MEHQPQQQHQELQQQPGSSAAEELVAQLLSSANNKEVDGVVASTTVTETTASTFQALGGDNGAHHQGEEDDDDDRFTESNVGGEGEDKVIESNLGAPHAEAEEDDDDDDRFTELSDEDELHSEGDGDHCVIDINQFMSVDDFKGNDALLRKRLENDEAKCQDNDKKKAAAAAASVPAWMLSILQSSTKKNNVDDEMKRLLSLQRFRILDESSRDATLDRLTAMAARVFGADVVCVDLVDLGRLKVLSNSGLGPDFCYAPRNDSFCSHAIQSSDYLNNMFIIPDTHDDVRFCNHWLVKDYGMRFYAAANLVVDGNKVSAVVLINFFWERKYSCA